MWTGEWFPGTRPDVARASSPAGLRTIEEVTRVFTGIVEELGHVVEVTKLADDSARLVVSGPLVTADATHGDSIAVNGVCLTVVDAAPRGPSAPTSWPRPCTGAPWARSSPGTRSTWSGRWPPTAGSAGTSSRGTSTASGRIRARRPSENWEVVEVELPEDLSRFLVEKGSITVDGVSLTVVEVVDGDEPWFSVSLIPTTLAATTLGSRQVGDAVNLEVDVIAKYVERMVGVRA